MKTIANHGFAERLSNAINESGHSRPQFAAKIGVGTSCLAKWLNGHLLPKSMQLLAIAQGTGKTMEWLLIGDTESDGDRLERLRLERQITWLELADALSVSESMAYQVRSGKRRLSKKALVRLDALENQSKS